MPLKFPPKTDEAAPSGVLEAERDPLAGAVADWQRVAHGGKIDPLLADLRELERRESLPGASKDQRQQDYSALNKTLSEQGWLPNMQLLGFVDNRVVVGDTSRGTFGVLVEREGLTQVEDIDMSRSGHGVLQIEPNAAQPLQVAPGEIGMGGVDQGNIRDCIFESRLSSLALEDPDAIRKMIRSNTNGTFTVKFPGDPQHPETVPPPTPWARNAFGRGASEWSLIVGSAYRKREQLPFGPGNASAQHIDGLLTGKPGAYFVPTDLADCNSFQRTWESSVASLWRAPVCYENRRMGDVTRWTEALNGAATEVDRRDFGGMLDTALKNHMLLMTGFDEARLALGNNRSAIDRKGNAINLEARHAYSVVAYDANRRLVVLRNPWGFNADPTKTHRVGDGTVVLPLDQFSRTTLVVYAEKTSKSQ
jgi:hypothetical protein